MTFPSSPILIRDAQESDLEAMTLIYSWHVIHGCASFEETPPGVEEMSARHAKVLSCKLPWLVAEINGHVAGYCYAALYRERPAYRFTAEDSVYIDAGMVGQGIGTALLQMLIQRCSLADYRQILAVVGDGENNQGSLRLHQKMGFEVVGNLRNVGFKHGKWRDTLLMQLSLQPLSGEQR